MISKKYRTNQRGNPFQSGYVSYTVYLFGESSDTDTYISSAPNSEKQVFDRAAGRNIFLPTGEEDSDLLLRRRPVLKVGTESDTVYRSILVFEPSITLVGELGDRIYNTNRVTLRLAPVDEMKLTGFQAELMSGTEIDETVSWNRASETREANWSSPGGDSDPPLSGTPTLGYWTEDGLLEFDVSEIYTQWSSTGRKKLAIIIKGGDTTEGVQSFHSWDSVEGYLGDSVLTNCKFLAEGDATSSRTEGVRAVLSPDGNNVLLTQAETNATRLSQFYSFSFSTPIGATFEVLDPDINNSVTIGTKVCTLLDKPSADSMLLSGFTLPNSLTQHETTVEFASNTTIPYGSHVLEIQTPSTETVNEALALYPDQKLKVRYYNPPANNNSRNFTVAFVSDERRYKDRIRVFLNEQTVSENRNGLGTEILLSETKPVLMIDLLLV
jgi:hypothetical protein